VIAGITNAGCAQCTSLNGTYVPSSLLKRFETPEEVAAMVVYVCSPRAFGHQRVGTAGGRRRDPVHRVNGTASELTGKEHQRHDG
jgi:hypothetical protein